MDSKSYTDNELMDAVKSSFSISEVLKRLGLQPAGGNYKVFHQNVNRLGLDTSHFTGQKWRKGSRESVVKRKPLEELLVSNSSYSTFRLKNRLIEEGVFERKCSSCGLLEWMGVPMPLELEHINGINNDHSIENLCLLCPNCHALTSTYRGRNKRKRAGLVE